MDPTGFIQGLGDSLKASLRASDEPRDLAYYMVLGMQLSVWLAAVFLPWTMLGGVIVGMFVWFDLSPPKALGDIGFTVGLALLAGVLGYLGARIMAQGVIHRLAEREARLDEKAKDIQWHMDFHATHGAHEVVYYVVGEDAKEHMPEVRRQFDAWAQEAEEPEE